MTIQTEVMESSPNAIAGERERYLLSAYLIFTVCFYAYRFLFGLGSDLTAYDSDAPGWLRVSKDIVWICFLLLALVLAKSEHWNALTYTWRGKRKFLVLLAALICTFMLQGWIHLLFYQTAADTFLYWYRYPLEYIPIVLILPIFVDRWEPLGRLAVFLCYLSILFLAYEILSGRETGFVFRYGSIFGSPNDFGLFCTLMILGLLVYGRTWKEWVLVVLMSLGLLASMSRSAILGLAVGLCMLTFLRRVRRTALVWLLLLCSAAGFVAWRYPELLQLSVVTFATEHFGVDESALIRVDEMNEYANKIRDLNPATLLFGTNYFHVESWYLALLIRTGVIGLVSWILMIGVTLRRGWKLRKMSRVHAVAMASVAAISAACVFVPLPDMFPTNFYLWLAVGIIWLPAIPKESAATL